MCIRDRATLAANAANERRRKRKEKSGKFDKNGRMLLVEPFKPGKKSRAFPRSGDRSQTFR